METTSELPNEPLATDSINDTYWGSRGACLCSGTVELCKLFIHSVVVYSFNKYLLTQYSFNKYFLGTYCGVSLNPTKSN